uniref:Transposase Tc1-like domain-containing protein n=1 Tax=Ditylenchus dipsaci TaxID=166011 RepID=A0A915DNF1_9BILA
MLTIAKRIRKCTKGWPEAKDKWQGRPNDCSKIEENPKLTAPEIREELKLDDITVRTVQNRLIEVGLFGRRPAEKPFISPKNVKERLSFAKEHQNWTVDQWKSVLWSDESKFNMIGSDGKGYVRRPVNKRFDPKYTKGTVKLVEETLWSGLFLVAWTWTSQTDLPAGQRSKHKAKIITKGLQDNSVDVMQWPAQSPDLNLIENLWYEAERRMGGHKHKMSDELFKAVKKAWESIPKERLEKLVESMPRRCRLLLILTAQIMGRPVTLALRNLQYPKIATGQALYEFDANDVTHWMTAAYGHAMEALQNWLANPNWIAKI